MYLLIKIPKAKPLKIKKKKKKPKCFLGEKQANITNREFLGFHFCILLEPPSA